MDVVEPERLQKSAKLQFSIRRARFNGTRCINPSVHINEEALQTWNLSVSFSRRKNESLQGSLIESLLKISLETYWRLFEGRLLGDSQWYSLGTSWGPLETCWGLFEASLGPLGDFLRALGVFLRATWRLFEGPLETSPESFGDSLRTLRRLPKDPLWLLQVTSAPFNNSKANSSPFKSSFRDFLTKTA